MLPGFDEHYRHAEEREDGSIRVALRPVQRRRPAYTRTASTMHDGFDRSIVESTAHRPWPMPRAPWLMTQSWNGLLFAHWRVDALQMRRAVPDAFDLDLYDGEAWLGVVPFYMTHVGLRATPGLPWLSGFPELNVRTDVRVAERPGVYLQPRRRAPARRRGGANAAQPAVPHAAVMSSSIVKPPALSECAANPRSCGVQRDLRTCGEPFAASTGSLEHFLTERYCLITTIAEVVPIVSRFTIGRGPSRSRARQSRPIR